MKRNGLYSFITFCLFLSISMTSSAKKEEVRLHLSKGQQFTYLITQENTINENPEDEAMLYQKMGLKIHHEVMERLGNGNFLIEATFVNFNLELKFDGKVSRYDSDTVNVLNKYYKSLNFLTQLKLTYEVSELGVVSNLAGFEPIKKNIENDKELSGLLRGFGTDRFIIEFYNHVPHENVGVGDKWTSSGILPDLMNLKYDIFYSCKEATEKGIKLNKKATFTYLNDITMADGKKGQIKENGTQKGTLLIHPQSHLCVSSEMDQRLQIYVPHKDKPVDEKTVPIVITSITKMQLVKK